LRALPVIAVLLLAAPAQAARYSKGVYAEMGLGGTGFLARAGGYAAPGPSFALRGGYDLFSWFSLGGRLESSMHEATVPPPPEEEYFQLYHLAADGRITARIRRVALFAEGGLGLAIVNTNVLDNVGVTAPDEHLTPAFSAGGGVDYHTQNRHFSVGLAADWTVYPVFDSAQSITVRLYLRYTR
jgi:hypothetical protein